MTLNLGEAAEEITEEANTFLVKIRINQKERQTQYLAALPEKLGVAKLQELRKVAESSFLGSLMHGKFYPSSLTCTG